MQSLNRSSKTLSILIIFIIGLTFGCEKDTNEVPTEETIDETTGGNTGGTTDGNTVGTTDGNTGGTTDGTTDGSTNETNIGADVPEIYSKIYSASDIYLEGDYVVIEVDGVPDHNSPYFSSSSSQYEAYNGDNPDFRQNPNTIESFDFVFKIPLNPTEASEHSATPLGSMGVALNGVSFFNQYAGPNNQPLTNEIDSFDQYAGHPNDQGTYHYHIEPTYLTETLSKEDMLGFLLDGFPVYGPEEEGVAVTNDDLDDYHGHSHVTTDYPDGTYHYHVTDTDPYINGSGYYGTPGTVTQ